MKVREFLKIITHIHTLNPEADVRFVYNTENGLRYQNCDEVDIHYNQYLENNKLIIDESVVVIDLGE